MGYIPKEEMEKLKVQLADRRASMRRSSLRKSTAAGAAAEMYPSIDSQAVAVDVGEASTGGLAAPPPPDEAAEAAPREVDLVVDEGGEEFADNGGPVVDPHTAAAPAPASAVSRLFGLGKPKQKKYSANYDATAGATTPPISPSGRTISPSAARPAAPETSLAPLEVANALPLSVAETPSPGPSPRQLQRAYLAAAEAAIRALEGSDDTTGGEDGMSSPRLRASTSAAAFAAVFNTPIPEEGSPGLSPDAPPSEPGTFGAAAGAPRTLDEAISAGVAAAVRAVDDGDEPDDGDDGASVSTRRSVGPSPWQVQMAYLAAREAAELAMEEADFDTPAPASAYAGAVQEAAASALAGARASVHRVSVAELSNTRAYRV